MRETKIIWGDESGAGNEKTIDIWYRTNKTNAEIIQGLKDSEKLTGLTWDNNGSAWNDNNKLFTDTNWLSDNVIDTLASFGIDTHSYLEEVERDDQRFCLWSASLLLADFIKLSIPDLILQSFNKHEDIINFKFNIGQGILSD